MIKKVPTIYPNESAYSWLARTYAQSGVVFHKCFASEVFAHKNEMIDFNFINVFSPSFKKVVSKSIGFRELLLNHTLFKYYARHMKVDERIEAYKEGIKNSGLLAKKMHLPPNRNDYYLRYCPACVEEDRQRYGECYFHIEHQIFELRICPIHRVKLIDTRIQNNKKGDSVFSTLEQLDPQVEACAAYGEKDINYLISKYIYDVFQRTLSIKNDVLISDYFTSLLNRAQCVDNARTKKNIIKLTNDISDFYRDLSIKNFKPYRICDIYRGVNLNPYDILLIAYFHKIKPKDLAALKLPKESIRRPIMRRVYDLYNQGQDASAIAFTVSRKVSQVQRIIDGYRKIKRRG